MRQSILDRPLSQGARWKALVFPVILPFLLACGFLQAATPTPTPAPASTPTPTTASVSLDPLGSRNNPLILALPPSSAPASNEVINAGKNLVGLLQQSTGYTIVSVIPPSEADLVEGFAKGNADIGVLSPFAYLLASNAGTAEAAFARQQGNVIFYGAQFIAHDNAGFTAYFDEVKGGNIAEADVALGQFRDKKPCWTDDRSPSGYVVPLGYLNQARVQTRPPAFLAGHVAVVRAIDMGGICDFGATYVDARKYPGVQDQYPDVLRQVDVIWRIPPIIPYETLAFVSGMDEGMRRSLTRAFVDLETTPNGKAAMQILYGFDAMQVVQDSQYDPFRQVVKASGLDLNELIK